MKNAGHGRPDFYLTVKRTQNPSLASGECAYFRYSSAFTWVELLVVLAVICTMMSLLVPAVGSIASSNGRKGAVTIVMNTLEQARVSAIETSREVVVLFWKKNGIKGSQPDEQDAMLVLRRDTSGTTWEPISRWVKLPKGVLFHGEDAQSDILKDSSPLPSSVDTTKLLGTPDKNNLGAVQFSSSGAVQTPNSSSGLRIALTEGQRDSSGDVLVRKQKSGGYEVISIARYTGRSTLDITSL